MGTPQHNARRVKPHSVPTVKSIVRELAVLVPNGTDYEGRNVGLSYDEIAAELRRRLPVVKWNGPHVGSPLQTSTRQIREIIYTWRKDEADNGRMVILPKRPRMKRHTDKIEGETDEKSQNASA